MFCGVIELLFSILYEYLYLGFLGIFGLLLVTSIFFYCLGRSNNKHAAPAIFTDTSPFTVPNFALPLP